MKPRNSAATYVVATVKPWNIRQFKSTISKYPGTWYLVSEPEKLTRTFIDRVRPRYIFFPHWSWKVPKEIVQAAECVCFHEADVPYGRGGSPIQNLIERGHSTTKITALRMEEGMDTGPVYLKTPLSLKGSAQEIFERTAPVVSNMIRIIVTKNPAPRPQSGKPVVFKRRTPAQSDITKLADPTPRKVYDFIRMLDAETYPRAYAVIGGVRVEFRNARLEKNKVKADAIIQSI